MGLQRTIVVYVLFGIAWIGSRQSDGGVTIAPPGATISASLERETVGDVEGAVAYDFW